MNGLDLIFVALTYALAGVIGGLVGGALGYAGARAIYDRIVRNVMIEIEATAATITAPVIVDLRLHVPDLEPISVPVEAEIVNATPNVELTRRLLDEAPQLGPRALARIFQCSTSTAQTYYVQSAKTNGTPVTPADGQALNLIATEQP